MEIKINFPKWAKEKVKRGASIFFTVGHETLGVYCNGRLWVKTKQCNLCGKCCIVDTKLRVGSKTGDEVGWGKDISVCGYLERQTWHFQPYNGKIVYVCTAGASAPFGCAVGPSPACGNEYWKEMHPECVLEYEEQLEKGVE